MSGDVLLGGHQCVADCLNVAFPTTQLIEDPDPCRLAEQHHPLAEQLQQLIRQGVRNKRTVHRIARASRGPAWQESRG